MNARKHRGRWTVVERHHDTQHGHRGGRWARTSTKTAARLLRRKILAGRYRGTRPWSSWRRTDAYTPPAAADLTVERDW